MFFLFFFFSHLFYFSPSLSLSAVDRLDPLAMDEAPVSWVFEGKR